MCVWFFFFFPFSFLKLVGQCKLKDSRPINWDSSPINWPAAGFALFRVLHPVVVSYSTENSLIGLIFSLHRLENIYLNTQRFNILKELWELILTDTSPHLEIWACTHKCQSLNVHCSVGAHWCSCTNSVCHVWQKYWLKRKEKFAFIIAFIRLYVNGLVCLKSRCCAYSAVQNWHRVWEGGGWLLCYWRSFFLLLLNEKYNHLSPCGIYTLIRFRNSCPSIDFTVPEQIFWWGTL